MERMLIISLIPVGVLLLFGSALWLLLLTMLRPSIIYLSPKTIIRFYAWKPATFFILGCVALLLAYMTV